jgi:hypothetical protein
MGKAHAQPPPPSGAPRRRRRRRRAAPLGRRQGSAIPVGPRAAPAPSPPRDAAASPPPGRRPAPAPAAQAAPLGRRQGSAALPSWAVGRRATPAVHAASAAAAVSPTGCGGEGAVRGKRRQQEDREMRRNWLVERKEMVGARSLRVNPSQSESVRVSAHARAPPPPPRRPWRRAGGSGRPPRLSRDCRT